MKKVVIRPRGLRIEGSILRRFTTFLLRYYYVFLLNFNVQSLVQVHGVVGRALLSLVLLFLPLRSRGTKMCVRGWGGVGGGPVYLSQCAERHQ